MKEFLYSLAADKWTGFFPSLIKFVLFILSLIYGLLIRLLMAVCEGRQYLPACKVISVGNITVGGTGKTPLVEYIAKRLKENGHSTAVVTRGHKRIVTDNGTATGPSPTLVHNNVAAMGDEPYMLQRKLKDIPVIVDADRIRAIKSAVTDYGAGTVILDDGFQQWKIKKDLEIVVIDAVNPFGNRQMIPRGILRQPVWTLKKADVFVLTKTNLNSGGIENIVNFLKGINPDALIVEAVYQPMGFYDIGVEELLDIHTFSGQTVALVSGIGDPDSFEKLVKELGVIAGIHFKFPDHHNYSGRDMDRIVEFCKQHSIRIIVTTEKDAGKLSSIQHPGSGIRVFVLPIELKLTKYEREFLDKILPSTPTLRRGSQGLH